MPWARLAMPEASGQALADEAMIDTLGTVRSLKNVGSGLVTADVSVPLLLHENQILRAMRVNGVKACEPILKMAACLSVLGARQGPYQRAR